MPPSMYVEKPAASYIEYDHLRVSLLIDHLRVSRSADFTLLSESQDLIDFLMGLEFLQKRTHLLHLFKLCCLCITSPSSQLPVVTIGSIDTNNLQGRSTDVIFPGQSYLVNVPGSISHCVSDQCLSKFSLLSSDLDRPAFSSEYDPWTYVDSFGRSVIFKYLLNTYKSVISGPKTGTVRMSTGDVSSVAVEYRNQTAILHNRHIGQRVV